ncbi:MAG: EAL domain-containing protein [Sphingomonas bacterium]
MPERGKGDPPLIVVGGVAGGAQAPYRLHSHADFIHYALDSAAIVAVTDVRGTITYVNSKFCEISGYSEAELLGSNHRMLKSGAHDVSFFRAMYRQIARGSVWHGELCNRRKDGSLYWVDTTVVPHISAHGKVDSYTSIRFDITGRKQLEDELQASRRHLKTMAELDPLTNLPNRRCFQEFIETRVGGRKGGKPFFLALMDVDTFKEINDSFGHPAGDELLRALARRLRAIADERLFISRLGGDEFGLIFTGSRDEAEALFERVLETMRQPFNVVPMGRRCSVSIGLAAYPEHATDGAQLFKAADLALYRAKALGRDRLETFEPSLMEVAARKAQLLAEIERGLRRDAFEMHYQPIVPLNPDRPISYEALMRWRHPDRGLLSPVTFQDGFADPAARAALGLFSLERVFRDIAALCAMAVPLGRVGINLTNSDFRSDVFLDRFFQLVDETGIGPEKFCVEVTEGMFLGLDQKRVEQGLQRLHEAGVEVALDDFGTGYASLTHLRRLPIDRLKIDRSFVANMVMSQEDQAIVRGVIDIAHSLGKVVTAEGVETMAQMDLLLRMGCDFLQGWYFGRACRAEELPALLSLMPDVARIGRR